MGIDPLVAAIRLNGHIDSFELVHIVEEHLQLVNTYYALRQMDTFDAREPNSLPLFRTPDIVNLQVCACIWRDLDECMYKNWLALLKILHDRARYWQLIGYHPVEQAFIFKWRRNTMDTKVMCWNCKQQHKCILSDPGVIWGLDQFISDIK